MAPQSYLVLLKIRVECRGTSYTLGAINHVGETAGVVTGCHDLGLDLAHRGRGTMRVFQRTAIVLADDFQSDKMVQEKARDYGGNQRIVGVEN